MFTFYALVITQTLSMIGSRMSSTAIALRVFAETGDTAPILLVPFFNELPAMLGSSFAGVWIDRWDRRWVLMITDAGQALGSLLLMVSFLSGSFQLWHLYAVALLNGIFNMFQSPAKDATVTLLVPEKQRERANALQAISFPLAGTVAPALTGLLYGIVGLPGIILIDLGTFLVAVGTVFRLHIPRPPKTTEGQETRGNFWRELAGGFRYLGARRALLGLVIYFTVMNFLLNGPLELSVPYLMTVTHSTETTGLILAMNSLGGFVGAGILSAWGGTRPRIHTVLPAMLLVGAMFLAFGTAQSPWLLGASIFLLMVPLQTWAIYTSILQIKTPPDMQGRMFAIVGQLGYLGATASFLLTGPLVDRVLEPRAVTPGDGMRLVLIGAGLIMLVLTLAVYLMPRVRHLERDLPDYAGLEG